MKQEIVKFKGKVTKRFFPKNGLNSEIEPNSFGILCVKPVKILEGKLKTHMIFQTAIVKGNIIPYNSDTVYTFLVKENEPDKYGESYSIIQMKEDVNFDNIDFQKQFLDTILTKLQIEELYKTLNNPFKAIKEGNIKELVKVKGIKETTAKRIIDKFQDNKDYSVALVRLTAIGLTPNTIKSLCNNYGNPDVLMAKIKKNPYILADEVKGIGWIKADEIALKTGIDKYSTQRIEAFIRHSLKEEAYENGNTYCPIDDIYYAVECLLELSEGDADTEIGKSINNLLKQGVIWVDKNKEYIALKEIRDLEYKVATELQRINGGDSKRFNCEGWEDKIRQQELAQGWNYTKEQRQGIKITLNNNLSLIQGYAGTGKSSIVAGMIKVLSGYRVAQCALSGKASVNLAKVTGKPSYTIHRLLGFTKGGFTYNAKNKLPYDIIVIDEISMVDLKLFYSLIQAVDNDCKVIMLGDIGQLECIGVGNLMKDLIDSQVVSVINLTEIHRQAKKSAIINDSVKVWKGEQIINSKFNGIETRGELQDFTLDIYKGSEPTGDKILGYFKKLYKTLPENITNVQIIVPTRKRGEACTQALNTKVQQFLLEQEDSPLDKSKFISNSFNTFYIGDRVINIHNNYNIYSYENWLKIQELNGNTEINYDDIIATIPTVSIMNGNIGKVVDIIKDGNQLALVINFEASEEDKVVFPLENIKEDLELAYAITCHKSQGSQFNYVICGIDGSHYVMRTKELLYTILTRAKKHCYLCGDNASIRYCCGHSSIKYKRTFLVSFLQKLFNKNHNF